MATGLRSFRGRVSQIASIALLAASVLALGSKAQGQVLNQAVGGISINADGVLDNASLDAVGKLSQLRAETLQKIPAELGQAAALRKVSLRGLEAAIEQCAKTSKALPDDIRYLGGLQQIRYVLVYPEQNDIVLVGPGEGWKVDAQGDVVGVKTGRPVLLLDDLAVALRSADRRPASPARSTPRRKVCGNGRCITRRCTTSAIPARRRPKSRSVLGPQQITFSGVPDDQPLRPRAGGGRLSHEAVGDGFREGADQRACPASCR